jgi:tetratricopeptide (TPR) repeat protein
MKRASLFLFILLFTLAGAAQHEHHGDDVAWVPREVLERPVPLRDGIGNLHEKVTTESQPAQAFYDQGLNYLHSYVWIEAARSFKQALREDATLIMAWVNLSRVYANMDDLVAAAAAQYEAQKLAKKNRATDAQKMRIKIQGAWLTALSEPNNEKKERAYKKLLDQALAGRPKDIELMLLRGNSEEAHIAGRGQRGGKPSMEWYHKVLAVEKENAAAHHYLIHSNELIGDIPQALVHGEIYARLAAEVPHAQHMYAHDLRRTGRIDEAIERFQRAKDLEDAYYAAEKIDRSLDWHHSHNLNLLATAYQYRGEMKTAERLMKEAQSMKVISDYQAFFHKEYPEFLLGRGRVNEALAAAQEMAGSTWPMARAAGHALAGSAHLQLNDAESAQAMLRKAEAELAGLREKGRFGPAAMFPGPYVDALKAELMLRSGKRAEAGELLKNAIQRIRAVPGPDAWTQALFRMEYMGKIARQYGDWKLAAHIAQQMLDHDAHYGGTHYALALVAEHDGERAKAREHLQQAQKYWAKADSDLAELVDLKSKLGTETAWR